ncbi:MAG: hypothetical protein K2O14_10705 [Oscillospiraceae bacterium]|nr:hypothetical protein [Oscillospiraceae bacterium]
MLLNNIKLIASALAGVTASVVTYKSLMAGANFITNFNSSAKTLVSTFRGLKTATDGATAAQTANNAAAAANPYMAVISVISVLVGVFVTLAGNIDSTTDKIEKLRQSTKDFISAAEESKSAEENIRGLAEEYTKLKTAAQETDEAKERLKEIQELLLTTYGTEANQLDLVNGKYAEQLELLNELANAKSEDAEINATAAYADYLAAESLERQLSQKYDDRIKGIANNDLWELIKKSAEDENTGIEITYESGKDRIINVKGNTEQKMNAYKAILDAYKQTGFALDDAGNYSEFAALYDKYKKLYFYFFVMKKCEGKTI